MPDTALPPGPLPAPAPRLDEPLPAELTGRQPGWFTAYRRYPVFSRPWIVGRWRLWGVAWLQAMAMLAFGVAQAPPEERVWGLMLLPAVGTLLPIVAVPWLGLWVRRQGWPAAREGWALALAIVGPVLLITALRAPAVNEPMRQWIAERTGMVDGQGRRRDMRVALGLSLHALDTSAPAGVAGTPDARPVIAPPPEPGAWSQGLIWAAINFWLAGGLALWGWRREQAGLLALQRERALAQAQAAQREAELQLSVLAAQVEPHFLFNTLAGVRSAIATDPARASVMVDRLVDYLRASIPRLRSDGSAQATLGGQLDMVRAYLGLMAARMPRLGHAVEAPAQLLLEPCPPWMLISLVENAVHHGIEPKPGPARVEVQASRAPDGGLDIRVLDDGVGFGGGTHGTGLGLANIRARLQQMYAGRGTLTLQARPEGGVCATLHLPPTLPAAGPAPTPTPTRPHAPTRTPPQTPPKMPPQTP